VITIYNIRGTNGSGKSTLARSFIIGDPACPPNRPGDDSSATMVDLTWYKSPTKREPHRLRYVEGYASPQIVEGLDVLVVGSYRTACGGLDAVPDFATTFKALDGAVGVHRRYDRSAQHQAIVAEGVLASTVWGSWGEYASNLGGRAQVAFCYLDTPLEVCLERIRRRQEAAGKVRDIKEDLVKDKIKAIAATREKAMAAGALVYDLPWETAAPALAAIMRDEDWLVGDPAGSVSARGFFSA
jgi:predicted ABC-type ATPase